LWPGDGCTPCIPAMWLCPASCIPCVCACGCVCVRISRPEWPGPRCVCVCVHVHVCVRAHMCQRLRRWVGGWVHSHRAR
jgi:hypothetical protein